MYQSSVYIHRDYQQAYYRYELWIQGDPLGEVIKVIPKRLLKRVQQMWEVCDRIRKLWKNGKLEASAQAVLKCLGELKRPYLTVFEEKLLSVIEAEYGQAE